MRINKDSVRIGLASLSIANDPLIASRWEIPQLSAVTRNNKGAFSSPIKRSILDAYYVNIYCWWIWIQISQNKNQTLAHAELENELYAFDLGKKYSKRPQLGGGEPISFRNAIKQGRSLIQTRTPYKDEDELRIWYKIFKEDGDISGEPEVSDDERTEKFLRITVALSKAITRSDQFQVSLITPRRVPTGLKLPNGSSIPAQWTLPGFNRPKKDYEDKEFVRFHFAHDDETPSLGECFEISWAAWVNAADLWSCYDFYRDYFSIGALCGRLMAGFAIELYRHQARQLHSLMMLGEDEASSELLAKLALTVNAFADHANNISRIRVALEVIVGKNAVNGLAADLKKVSKSSFYIKQRFIGELPDSY